MEITKEIGLFEIIAIGVFILILVIQGVNMYLISKKVGSKISSIQYLKSIIRSLYVTLILVALLAPSFGSSRQEVKAIAKDIFIAIDLSQSMNARDIQPSRLEKVKFELKNIVDAFVSDRIGMIIFSNEAFVQCPLTYDKSALSMFIETLGTHLVPNAGTNFYEPLQLANEKLMIEDEQSKTSSKLIILISDGEDFADNTNDIIDELENNRISLFTLGVGTERGGKIPAKRGNKKDRSGNDVVSKLNAKDLKKLSYKTKGKYYEINQNENQIEKLINDINKIEGELKQAKMVDVSANKYFYFLIGALFLIVIDVFFKVNIFKL